MFVNASIRTKLAALAGCGLACVVGLGLTAYVLLTLWVLVRVHDVAASVDALRVVAAVEAAR